MAHRILGIDLGAYSVKIIAVSPGFRSAAVTDFFEQPVPAGDEPYEQRAARVVAELVLQHSLGGDTPYAAVPGDKLFIHILEFPFRSLRRQDLEKAVGAELEGILPLDLEDIVFGFESLPDGLGEEPVLERTQPLGPGSQTSAPGAPPVDVADDEPTNVQRAPLPAAVSHGRAALPADGMRILACAMELGRARQLIELLGEPRGLVAAPASYMRVIERLPRLAGEGASAPPVAIIDIGHLRTDLCVVKNGRAAYARTIARGGHHLTETISRAWRISYQEAQRAKHTDALIGSTGEPIKSEQWQRIHEVVVQELGPLAKDIKRSLKSCRAKTGATVSEVLLVGGGSRVRGLASYMADVLHLPVSTLDAVDSEAILGAKLASSGISADAACLAAGVAFEGASGRPHFDLRQGELAYKADLSILRQKLLPLATACLVIIGFLAVNAYAALYNLRTSESNLDERLALETAALFGSSLSASDALERTQGRTGGKKSPLPRMSAYDVMLEINQALPDRKDVALDVYDLDIKAGKINIKASAHSNAEIDKIEEKLKSIKCFEDVARGDTSVGPGDVREFSFSIKSNCMQQGSESR